MSISLQGSPLGGNELFWGDAEGLGQNSKNSHLVVMLIIHNNLKTLLSNICISLL